MEISHQYDDIIDLPHHVSERHPQMPLIDRAAQFSPFAAVIGYDAAIIETARLTDKKRELSEEQKLEINRQLNVLQTRIKTDPTITVVFFEADSRKNGGEYRTVIGSAKRIDPIFHKKDDETEILIRILSFGPVLKVLEPAALVDQIVQRLDRQLLYGNLVDCT